MDSKISRKEGEQEKETNFRMGCYNLLISPPIYAHTNHHIPYNLD